LYKASLLKILKENGRAVNPMARPLLFNQFLGERMMVYILPVPRLYILETHRCEGAAFNLQIGLCPLDPRRLAFNFSFVQFGGRDLMDF